MNSITGRIYPHYTVIINGTLFEITGNRPLDSDGKTDRIHTDLYYFVNRSQVEDEVYLQAMAEARVAEDKQNRAAEE